MTDAAERRRSTLAPSDYEIEAVLYCLEQYYSGMDTLPDDWDSFPRFQALLRELDFSSSPGWPYMREAPTIGAWLGWDGVDKMDPVQVDRLWFDVQRVMLGDYKHIFRVFVKDEPHKIAKAQASKWRLIIAASLPVQMAWRMCFSHQNKWLNDHPYETPSAHGLVFCYGGWRRFMAHVNTLGLRVSRDISAWDVNAPGWVMRTVRDLRLRFSHYPDHRWRDVATRLYRDAYDQPRLLFSHGFVLQQQYSGFVKSGLFNTISDNSIAMVAMHVAASLRLGRSPCPIWATGDDVLQAVISDAYIDKLEELGCRVKEWEQAPVFMGTRFEQNGPLPMYLEKHLVKFVTSETKIWPELLDAYGRLYCHSDWHFELWRQVASHSGVTLRSQSYYRFWYDFAFAKLFKW